MTLFVTHNVRTVLKISGTLLRGDPIFD